MRGDFASSSSKRRAITLGMKLSTWFWAASFIVPATATPVLAVLQSGAEMNGRSITTMIISALVAAILAFKGYYSTTYGDAVARGVK